MATRRDVLTGLAALPIAASLPALPVRAMAIGEKLKPWMRYDHAAPEFKGWLSDDLLRIQASLAVTVRRIENMRP